MPDTIARETAAALADAALALARRFAHGATLWCFAPDHPHHAHHLAVEFVHPVVVGARALPAVAVVHETELRACARPGDAVVAIGAEVPADEGQMTIWLGAGTPPGQTVADHTIRLADDRAALYDGRVVLGYHLLWELTQICLEHPGLVAAPATESRR